MLPISPPLTPTTELSSNYKPGHYHPIHFGDLFKDGRYKVLRKLGYGSFATVWLAHDNEKHRYVALKVIVSKDSHKTSELSILNQITSLASTSSHPGRHHVTILLDNFFHVGPNGRHLCLVFEIMGSSAASMARELSCNQTPERKYESPKKYPLPTVKRLLRHTLLGLEFLHENGIVHGDLNPGNLLFSLHKSGSRIANGFLRWFKSKRKPSEFNKPNKLRKINENDEASLAGTVPKYLAAPQSLAKFVDSKDFTVKISDFGGAFHISTPPTEKAITPSYLCPPEMILPSTAGTSSTSLEQTSTSIHPLPTPKADIWAIGCLIYEFLTGTSLFDLSQGTTPERLLDLQLVLMEEIIGSMPEEMWRTWGRGERYFEVDEVREEDQGLGIAGDQFLSLEERFEIHRSAELTIEESDQTLKVMRWILCYEVDKRPTARELLECEWFSGE
ncbi:kinase-like domain-containing protein [Pyronema omphalodes]|nr:kinase-like domain-containing protein [Pyronema omphalodes]KAI5817670.1 kinase-like domain-containing protein [Pyronema omphalodes]